MKVLGVFHLYVPIHNAGAEWMAHAIFRRLIDHGHEVTVVYPRAPTYSIDGVLVTETPRRLEALAREVDVVVTHLDNTAQAMTAARHAGRPVVHLVHNDRQLQFHAIKPAPDVLIVPNSQWIARGLPKTYRSIICRPPVFVADYELPLERPRDAITLVNVTGPKGSATFYALAGAMRDRTFLGVRGAYGVPDTRRARSLRNVELVANTPNIAADVYARTRVLLMPSGYESWGRVAVEASAAFIPVIAHPTPGLVEALGDSAVFIDRRNTSAWRRELEALDDAGYYLERAWRAHARALELEELTNADLELLEATMLELVEERRGHHRPRYGKNAMPILDTVRAGLRCPVCGAPSCRCKPDPGALKRGGLTVIDAPKTAPGPHPIYRTHRGDFRYAEPHAIRYGLLPSSGDDARDLPGVIARRLAQVFSAGELERVVDAYAEASYDGRAAFLASVALLGPKALRSGLPGPLEALEADAGAVRPPAPAEELTGPADARVGDVLEWVGDDPERAAEALEAELGGRNRKTLTVELERRLAAAGRP